MNAKKAKVKTAATIDDYIAGFPPRVRAVLRSVRSAVRAAAPQAREEISYRIPAFRQHGVLVYFAAFKKHIGFFPPVRGDARLARAVAKYAGEKGNLRFPLDEPMPLALIGRLTHVRVKQDAERARHALTAKRARPKRAS